jgi:hypothetical protein
VSEEVFFIRKLVRKNNIKREDAMLGGSVLSFVAAPYFAR